MPVEGNGGFRQKLREEPPPMMQRLDIFLEYAYDPETAGQKRLISLRFTCFCLPVLGMRLAERLVSFSKVSGALRTAELFQ
jgi:hypothetical protein